MTGRLPWTKMLATHSIKLVLAESCTCGMVAAQLGGHAGISQFLCGSLVVYRASSKQAWLGISGAWLRTHGEVGFATTKKLAQQALIRTPEANLSVAVTGHLGPNAPAKSDGRIFIAIARRQKLISLQVVNLKKKSRLARQKEATAAVLEHLALGLRKLDA